ncbi:MAG TPA: hypothetical protein VMD02_01415 [Candidatus Omnitrophota bacterium]|nr:hypothetical protein [Candidatus Omnitrophota bacterium]
MSIATVGSRVVSIANQMQGKFLPQNYGYANAIRTGYLEADNGRLTIKTVSLTPDKPLPFYTCDSASHFAALELQKEGIRASIADIAIPIHPVQDYGNFTHKLCLAHDGDQSFMMGLATPVDRFLGINPCALVDDVPWAKYHLNSVIKASPSLLNARIYEHPSWNLMGIDVMIRPLLAANLPDGRLAIADIGMGSSHGIFYLMLVARIMRFDPDAPKITVEWNDNLFLRFPVNDLPLIRNTVSRLKSDPTAARDALRKFGFIETENHIVQYRSDDPGNELIAQAWPSMVEFIAKLPAGDIQKQLGGK